MAGGTSNGRELSAGPRALRILIVRLGAMGDVLHAMPAVGRLRHALPDCEIGWVVEKRWVPLLCASDTEMQGEIVAGRPLVNRVHTVDTRRWRKALTSRETYKELTSSFGTMRDLKYDVAIDFQGSIKSAVVASFSGARKIVGFAHPRETLAAMLYSQRVETTDAHVVDQNLTLAKAVADLEGETGFELPKEVAAEEWVSARLKELGVERFAIVAPTAGWKAKEWPAQRYGEVARWLGERGIASLINFGPGELDSAQQVVAAAGSAAHLFSCDIDQLVAVTRRSSLFVGGDTGPMHLAAALGVPVVALFGPTDPARNGPYGTRAKVLRSEKSVTSYSHVDRLDEGLIDISVKEVEGAAEELLHLRG